MLYCGLSDNLQSLGIADSICVAGKSLFELREGSKKLCTRFIKTQKKNHGGKLKNLAEYEKKIPGCFTAMYSAAEEKSAEKNSASRNLFQEAVFILKTKLHS